MRKISSARSSRRAPGLKDSDYDHEIALVDHAAETVTPQLLSPELLAKTQPADHALPTSRTADTDRALSKYSTAASTPSLADPGPSSVRNHLSGSHSNQSAGSVSSSVKSKSSKGSKSKSSKRRNSGGKVDVPRVEIEGEESRWPPRGRTWMSNFEKSLLR